MAATPAKAVIFDLDGTLVDSVPDIHAAANALLRAMGYQPISYEILCSFVGNGIPKLVERFMRASHIDITAERHASLTAQFVDLYAAKPVEKTRLYAGVTDFLSDLKSRGHALGICTNKDHALTMQVLEGMEISKFFDVVIGGDTTPVKKPDPAPLYEAMRQLGAAKTLYVGDSEIDAATAVAADVPFALFTQGYRKSEVADIPHDLAFSDYGTLPSALERLFST
ncbi:MAG: phosphoglycolate phosphatase [Alphaproteobacteria bacterium]|nr:phosphoglycolate phosphatase [Alphaproteobacteria bacterium]